MTFPALMTFLALLVFAFRFFMPYMPPKKKWVAAHFSESFEMEILRSIFLQISIAFLKSIGAPSTAFLAPNGK